MKAIVCKEFGPPSALSYEEAEIGNPSKNQILVDIYAAGVNFPDTLIIKNEYQFKPPLPFTPGGELAGIVSAVGEGVTAYKVGDEVIGMPGNGGFAEQILISQSQVFKKPSNMDFATASTLTFSAPFFIAILSIFFLRESVGIYRWSAIIIGFLGVIMIMRPSTDLFSLYSILPILVAFFWSVSMIVLKFIPDHYSTAKIQFYSLIFSILGAVALYIFTSGHSIVINQNDFMLMMLTGILGGTAAILFIYSYRLVSASKLASFEYFGIPSSFILGWKFFEETPINQLFPGAIAIVLAGLIIIWRDSIAEKIPEGSKKFY